MDAITRKIRTDTVTFKGVAFDKVSKNFTDFPVEPLQLVGLPKVPTEDEAESALYKERKIPENVSVAVMEIKSEEHTYRLDIAKYLQYAEIIDAKKTDDKKANTAQPAAPVAPAAKNTANVTIK